MWAPFTEPARRAIVLSQDVAQQRGSDAIDPDYVFIGIVREGDNPASRALASAGITTQRVAEACERALPRHPVRTSPELIFTQDAKTIIELAFQESRSLNHEYIGCEHLLLAYLAYYASRSALARELAFDPKDVREKTLAALERRPAPPPAPSTPRAQRTGLDDFFECLRRLDQAGTASAVERGTQKRLYYIDTDELWKRLVSAAGRRDLAGALMYAFIIAKRSDRNAEEAVREALSRLEQTFTD